MAALARFAPAAHKDLAASKLTRVFETKIFYIYRGRNAWHSTPVSHFYRDKCMHEDLRSAKDEAEHLREQGSFFIIVEQPALAWTSEKGMILITEVNTSTPLAHWIKRNRNEKSDLRLNQDYCRLEGLFCSTPTLGTLVGALDDGNIFPDYLPARSKNIFTLCTRHTDAVQEDHRRRYRQWRSYSQGNGYPLGWDEDVAKVSGKAIRRVADALADRI